MLKDFDKDLTDLDLSDEVKQQLLEAANKRAKGLSDKNDELLGKLSSTKGKIQEGQSAAEKLAAMEALQEQRELEAKQNYDQALSLNAEKYEKKIAELTGKVDAFETEKRDSLINGGIYEGLKELRVNPLHMDSSTAYFKQHAQLIDDKVMIGDQSLSDALSEWGETDSGKASRLAPDNHGGGAQGGTRKGGSDEKMTPLDRRAADINKRFGKTG